MSKSGKYIVAIALLLLANLWLFFSGKGDTIQASEKYFVTDDLQGASAFKFVFSGDTTTLEMTEDGWVVNDEYLADQGFVNTLISILARVEVGRTINNWNSGAMGSVEVEFDFNSRYRFDFGSNANKTKSYFITENGAKEVSVPGYRDNVIDIFTLHPDQWRDRMVLDGSWRTIQNIQVNNSLGEEFQISFDEKFFLVNGEPATDSSAVVNYLNQFQQFQANEMISSGRFDEMDSISETQPFARILIDDIKYEQPIHLEFYPNIPNQPYHLVKDQDGRQMVIDAQRVRQILSNPDRLN